VSIQNPAKCEVRAVIRFLHSKGEIAAEIHRQLVSVYGEVVMNRQNVAKWSREFEAERNDVHNEIRSGRPSVVTEKIIKKIDENIRADRRLTIYELYEHCPEMLRTVLHEIVTKRLGYRKLCAHLGAENVDRRSEEKWSVCGVGIPRALQGSS
jgi:transposase